MFGIGGTELIVIAIVLLIAVGPTRLPTLLKSVVKGYREFRRATRELRSSTGIDEILQDEDLKDLRDLRKPLYVPPAKKPAAGQNAVAAAPGAKKGVLSYAERTRESPPEGVDLAEIADAAHAPTPEEAARIKAEKEAIVQAKIDAAPQLDPEEERRIVEAKIAAAEQEASEAERAVIEAKRNVEAAVEAAADPAEGLDDEQARQRIIDAKLAAASSVEADDRADDEELERLRIIEAKVAAAAGEE